MIDQTPPQKLFEILSRILVNIKLAEIEVSPFIIPLEELGNSDQNRITSTSLILTTSNDTSIPDEQDLSPSSIHPFVIFEGDKLVIPQKPLYKAFAYAIKALSTFPRQILSSPTSADDISLVIDSNKKLRDESELWHSIDALTRVILLQNPEHSRALNLRKKLLLLRLQYIQNTTSSSFIKSSEAGGEHLQLLDLLQDELHLTKLILCIAANAKVASLWHHRKWLYFIQHNYKERGQHSNTKQSELGERLYSVPPIPLDRDLLEAELGLVELCAERYPRNYQAWAYRTWLMKGQLLGETSSSSKKTFLHMQQVRLLKHLSTHIGDHTAASHLIWLHRYVRRQRASQGGNQNASPGGEGFDDDTSELVTYSLDYVERYPDKETPWLLLRGVLSIRRQAETKSSKMPLEAIEVLTKRILDGGAGRRERGEDDQAWRHAMRMIFYLSCYNDKVKVADFSQLSSSEGFEVLEEARRDDKDTVT